MTQAWQGYQRGEGNSPRSSPDVYNNGYFTMVGKPQVWRGRDIAAQQRSGAWVSVWNAVCKPFVRRIPFLGVRGRLGWVFTTKASCCLDEEERKRNNRIRIQNFKFKFNHWNSSICMCIITYTHFFRCHITILIFIMSYRGEKAKNPNNHHTADIVERE